MNLFLLDAAQQQMSTTQKFMPFILMGLMFVVMYFVMIRPQKKRQKEEQEMRSSIEVGDEIVTIGGIVGRVVTVREEDIIVETGADKNKIRIKKWAIGTNVTKTEQREKEIEAARQAAKDKKAKSIEEKKDEKSDK